MEIFVYAIANRSGGAYSVLKDFYNEIIKKQDIYPDVKWVFLLNNQQFESTANVEIVNTSWCLKSWFHRYWFGIYYVRKLAKQREVRLVVSLQNMIIPTCKIPTVISLHNILPLYKCDNSVLDSFVQRVKQHLVNYGILLSMRKAYRIFVPNEWVQNQFSSLKSIPADKMVPIRWNMDSSIDEIEGIKSQCDNNVFFYPAAPYPYKNHQVILDACSLLEKQGIDEYKIIFTFDSSAGKTAADIVKKSHERNLNIEFVGNLPRSEVIKMYRENVLIFPSKIEMDAMPLMECEKLSSRVLAADLPYSRDILESYVNCLYFEPDDSERLAMLMQKCIEGHAFEETFKFSSDIKSFTRVDEVVRLAKEL